MMLRFTVTWLVWYSRGPTKQNSAIAATIPAPIIVRRLCRNEESVSIPLPVRGVASSAVTGLGSPTTTGDASGVAITNPWVKYPVGDIGGEVSEDGSDPDDERAA